MRGRYYYYTIIPHRLTFHAFHACPCYSVYTYHTKESHRGIAPKVLFINTRYLTLNWVEMIEGQAPRQVHCSVIFAFARVPPPPHYRADISLSYLFHVTPRIAQERTIGQLLIAMCTDPYAIGHCYWNHFPASVYAPHPKCLEPLVHFTEFSKGQTSYSQTLSIPEQKAFSPP